MMIVALKGGLGNQMFEYAFYKKLQIVYPNTKIYLSLFELDNNVHNGFELEKVFDIKLPLCNLKQWLLLAESFGKNNKIKLILNKLFSLKRLFWGVKNSYITPDDNSCFYKEVFELNPLYSYCFDGVWDNPKYFNDIRNIIVKEFRFKNTLEKQNISYKNDILKNNSVGLHIRRGDFIKLNKNLLEPEYYFNAIELICSKINNPTFYVFSDDIQYAKSLFNNSKHNFVFIQGNSGNNSYIDMELMSYCKHAILSNSTFSFWAGYLNQNESKIIITSKKPFNQCKYPFACDDWILL